MSFCLNKILDEVRVASSRQLGVNKERVDEALWKTFRTGRRLCGGIYLFFRGPLQSEHTQPLLTEDTNITEKFTIPSLLAGSLNAGFKKSATRLIHC